VYTDVGDGPVAEAEYHDWYDHEHAPARLTVPGPLGACRYEALDGPGAGFLSLHELAGPAVLSEPGYRAAVSTPWRDRIVSGALSRERRVLSFRNTFC